MESNAITVALIHFKCHCFKTPSAGSASGHTLCKSAQLAWPQWNYSDPNQLQIHPFVLSLHSQQEGGEKKKKSQRCRAQEVFCRFSHQLLSVRAAPLLLPTIRAAAQTRARLPAPLQKPLSKRGLMTQQGDPLAGTDHC